MNTATKSAARVLALAAMLAGCGHVATDGKPEGEPMLDTAVADRDRGRLPGFDDAVAEAVTTIEAAPGASSMRHWTPRTGGSVRIVGTIQKLSPTATAEFRILADGKVKWGRALGRADGIRHAFDVLAYDLTPASTIDFVAVAGLEPVQMKAAFQIVPEPFVSRWRANLPSGYPTFTDDRRVALRQQGQDLLQQIRTASAAGNKHLVIPPGDYLFHARWSQASTLKDLADLEIVADGVTFWFEPEMVHALLFENCRNVTVRGLTIDFTIPCWFQARVSDIDRGCKTLRATIMDGYTPRNPKGQEEREGNRALMFYDAEGRFINHRHTPAKWRLSDDGTSVTCTEFKRNGIPAALQVGDYVVGTIRTGAALRSKNCAGMRFEDVNVFSSPGIAVWEGGGQGGNAYRRVRATRRPRTNRLHAFGADVYHMTSTDRGPTLERCESAYSADDNLNIHGSFGRIVQRVSDRQYYLEGAYEVGDNLEFRDMKSVGLLGTAKAVSVQKTPGGPAIPINERYKAKGEFLVELDRPLELPPLALVVLDGKRSAQGFVLRDCWFHDNFQRTLINGSPGGLIENTTLQNVGMGLCIQFETWGPWMEGPFSRDLVIRNNRFLDAPPDGCAISVSMHPPGGGSNRRRFAAKPVTNMTITGNYFSRTSGTPVSIHNVDGLKIHGNSVDLPSAAPIAEGQPKWLQLRDCSSVTLEEN